MKGRIGQVLKYALMLGIGGVLFSLAMRAVEDPEALWADMKSANGWTIAASFVMGYLAIVSRGVRWLILLEPLGHRPKTWNSIHAVAFSYFSNTFVPRSGELARCGALNQTDGIPVDELFGTVISERVVDFAMLFLFTGIALLTNLDTCMAFANSFEWPGGGGGGRGPRDRSALAALPPTRADRRRAAVAVRLHRVLARGGGPGRRALGRRADGAGRRAVAVAVAFAFAAFTAAAAAAAARHPRRREPRAERRGELPRVRRDRPRLRDARDARTHARVLRRAEPAREDASAVVAEKAKAEE